MAFSLTYELEGSGWAMAQIQDEASIFNVTISYLHDSLRQLAEAAIDLLDGVATAEVVFMDEPGEIQLLLTLTGCGLEYELRWFNDWNSWGMHPSDQFDIVHRGQTTIAVFAGEVTKELEAILEKYGETGYKEAWIEAEFPIDLLRGLQSKSHAEQGGGDNSAALRASP